MKKTAAVLLAVTLGITGCANTNTLRGDVYTADQAKGARAVAYGTVLHVSEVGIQNKETGLGTLGGAVIGGIAGSGLGGGRGSAVLAAVGAVGGAVAGSKIEQGIGLKNGMELTIRKDNGSEFVVVQKSDVRFVPGARVKIIGSGDDINVTPF